jgi:hypothetical protein
MAKKGWEQVNSAQLGALQVLYIKWSAAGFASGQDERAVRTARLAWASENVGRSVSSFSDLTRDEARRLIDLLKTFLGQKLTRPTSPWRRIRAGVPAQQAGTSGRKGVESTLVQLSSADDLGRIAEVLERLGWSEERYRKWLLSARSPLRGSDGTIRTLADANRVYWALKAMVVRCGRWERTRAASVKRTAA